MHETENEIAVQDAWENPAVSDTTVGNLFQFSAVERALIGVMIAEYDAKAKAAWKTMTSLHLSVLQIDGARSRLAVVTEALERTSAEEVITLTAPLRIALGDACSMHARSLARKRQQLHDMLVETEDVQCAEERVQAIADRIGEQLVLALETPEDEA